MIFSGNILFVLRYIPFFKKLQEISSGAQDLLSLLKRLTQVRTPSDNLDLINSTPGVKCILCIELSEAWGIS